MLPALPHIAVAAQCAEGALATPYAQTVAHTGPGYALAATGLGGGAALLLPRSALEPVFLHAESALAPESRGDVRLRALFAHVDRALEPLLSDRYRGAGAEAVAAVADRDALYVASTGFCRAYQLDDENLVALTDDESVHAMAQRSVPDGVSEPLLRRLRARVLGSHPAGWNGGYPVVALRGGSAFGAQLLLCTGAVHECLPHAVVESLAREAFARGDLARGARAFWAGGYEWLRARERPAEKSYAQFARQAAVALVKVGTVAAP